MSLKALCEFAIHFDSFRNIDLFNQGLYHLRVSIYHEKAGQKIFAQPYNIQEGHRDISDVNKEAIPNIIPAHILDQLSAFCTRTFLIRFCDEEVELNELCHFRTEYDAYPEYEDQDFFLETELMYSDPISSARQTPQDGGNVQTNFKCVSTSKFKITNAHIGIHEFTPMIFDDQYYCLSMSMVHSTIMANKDLRFRTNSNPNSIESPKLDKTEETKTEASDYEFVIKPKTFKDFLSNATSKFKVNEVDAFYYYHIKMLKRGYEKLLYHYKLILNSCITPDKEPDVLKVIKSAPEELKYVPGESSPLNKSKERERKFSEICQSKDPKTITEAMLLEINKTSAQIFQLWHLCLGVSLVVYKNLSKVLQEEYHNRVRDKWGEGLFKQIYKIADLGTTYEARVGENHATMADLRRKTLYHPELKISTLDNVVDVKMFPAPEYHPILFEEVCIRDSQVSSVDMEEVLKGIEEVYTKATYKGVHLIVFCHGFQGNAFDMRYVKNNISLLHKNTLFLCASSNEDMTDGGIEEMGIRFADEVRKYIKEFCPGSNLGRLSFIGHSLGGLIIRAALPLLEEYKEAMHLYMTFSSPHLGYMYNSSKIIDAGIWLLKKWNKSMSLVQLSMTDNKKLEETYLSKLSEYKGLEWFKHIALMSSYQDQYAPFESARIQFDKKSLQDPVKGALYVKMARNILSRIQANCLYRIDVNYKYPKKTLDTLIGRTAHIQFLENQTVHRMLVYRYSNFFS